jgi:hypothetical protein
MLEAERTPIALKTGSNPKKDPSEKKMENSYKGEWTEIRVYLDRDYKMEKRPEVTQKLDRDGKILKNVFVHGFLRNQAHGPNHEKRKWVYIEGFDSTRWTWGKDVKYIIDTSAKRVSK